MTERLARLLVRLAAPLAHPAVRERWVEEWNAELWHARRGGGSPLRMALGAAADARATRRAAEALDDPPGDGPGRWRDLVGETTGMGRELRTSLRALTRTPAFTALAVGTLALGMGATAAIFAVVDSVVLRPLPYPDAGRLVRLDHPVPGQGPDVRWGLSVAGYFHFGSEMETLEALGAYASTSATLTGDDDAPERVDAVLATASLFRTLGARAARGRLFGEAEDGPGGEPGVVLSHGLWERRYGGDPAVVGSTVRIDGQAIPVLGVLEAGFAPPGGDAALWLPLQPDPTAPAQNSHYLQAVGRLSRDATADAAAAEMSRLTARLSEVFPGAYPTDFMEGRRFGADVRPLAETVVGDVGRTLWIVLAGVSIVLLVAGANVANLFLVRAEGRVREVAVRRALGADRASLAGLFLGEGLALAAAAGALGLLLAVLGVDTLVALAPPELPRLDEVAVRLPAVLVTAVLVVVAGLGLGSLPLLRARGAAPAEALGEGGRSRTGGRAAGRARGALVVAQVALALVLLSASGLMLRSWTRLAAVDPGLEPEGVLTFQLSLPRASYGDADEVYRFQRALLTALEGAPGVAAVGLTDALPVAGGDRCIGVTVEGEDPDRALARGCPQVRFVSPGYFQALGIGIDQGRAFEHPDNDARTGPLVVSRAMAREIWGDGEPVGRGVRLWGASFYRVVGVVDDIRDDGLDRASPAILYFPLRAHPEEPMPPLRSTSWVVKSASGVTPELVGAVRDAVARLDPDLPLAAVRSFEDILARSMVRTTFTLLLLGIAGGLALALGLVGMYAVMAYTVSQRTGELGIRIALGAGASRVRGMVLGRAASLAAVGALLGLLASWATTRLLGSLLFEVSATDPVALGGATLLLGAVALLAAWLPARRATRVDPVRALRTE